MTALGGFIGGNLPSPDASVLARSGPIALTGLAILALFYTLARSLGSVTWGLVLTYALICTTTYGCHPWLIGSVHTCAVCGLLYTTRFLRVARRHWGSVLLMGVMGTVTASAPTQTWIQFDILPHLHTGDVPQDFLYHASMAAMIKNYGPERRHCSRNPKWGPSDFGCEKLGDGHGLRRPAFVLLRPGAHSVRHQDPRNDWTLCRMAEPSVSAGAHAPDSDETHGPTPTRGSSHFARRLRSLAFLCSSRGDS